LKISTALMMITTKGINYPNQILMNQVNLYTKVVTAVPTEIRKTEVIKSLANQLKKLENRSKVCSIKPMSLDTTT
jgi:hypothetical protein